MRLSWKTWPMRRVCPLSSECPKELGACCSLKLKRMLHLGTYSAESCRFTWLGDGTLKACCSLASRVPTTVTE